jgi:hypothetical protein
MGVVTFHDGGGGQGCYWRLKCMVKNDYGARQKNQTVLNPT